MRLIRVSFSSLHSVTKQLVKTGHGNAIGDKLRYGKAEAGLGQAGKTPMKSVLIGYLSAF
jgi:hypothetical protein